MNSYEALNVFEGDDNQWYWDLKSSNGQIVATGGEGYKTEAGAHRGYAAAAKLFVDMAGSQIQAGAEAHATRLEERAETS